MATAQPLRSGGARVYSQSGDIDQLLEDVWVPDDSFQSDSPSTEKERALMVQLADAQRQLRELGRMRWAGGDGGSQNSGRVGYGGDRVNQTGDAHRVPGPYPHLPDSSWSDSRGSIDSRSLATNSDRESPEPLYVNTYIAAASAARAPKPPPRTSLPFTASQLAAPLAAAAAAAVAAVGSMASAQPAKVDSMMMPSHSHHQRSSEKASSSKHEESVEVKESVSIFQVYPPMAGGAVGGVTKQQPPSQAPGAASPLNRRVQNIPIYDGGVSPGGVFRFPPQSQAPPTAAQAWHGVSDGSSASSRGGHVKTAAGSSVHQSASSSRRTENYHSHGQNPSAPIPTPQAQSSYRVSEAVANREWGDSSVSHKSQHQQQQSYRSESAHVSSNSHSITQQSKEATSSAEHQSEGVSDVYSETTSLRPIGPGIQTLRSHTALHKLRQTNSGYPIDTNRIRTLNLSTPHLDQTPPTHTFRSDQQLAVPLQHSGVGPLRAATLQASAMEPRNSFLRASSSSQHHHRHNQQQQQQQQPPQHHLQIGDGFIEHSGRANFNSSGGGWAGSPGSVTPTRRYSGHSSPGGFDIDPPSPGGGTLKFVNDTSQFWYLPNISREEAIARLRPHPPGRFIVRDSTSFQGAYGLAVKVAEVPPGAAPAAAGDSAADELVRHFLIEQTSKGVRIRGCANEPVFASLAALIYQHTVMPLALPCKLALPNSADIPDTMADMAAAMAAGGSADPRFILEHGAACNVLYLGATDIESLTGSGGLSRAVDALLRNRDRLRSCACQLKVAKDGISITDTNRLQFFRKHYPTACVLYCGMDPGQRCFDSNETRAKGLSRSKIFGFVARKNPGSQENTAVVMCEIEEHQPAEAVVKFVCKYLIGSR